MVRPSGLEPPTPTMSRWCSNQLSYGRRMVRSIGLEPTTPTMSRWCSNQLSYERIVLSVTTGTNISGTAPRWQEGKCIFSLISRDCFITAQSEEKVAASRRLLCH